MRIPPPPPPPPIKDPSVAIFSDITQDIVRHAARLSNAHNSYQVEDAIEAIEFFISRIREKQKPIIDKN